jgi:hypothetical protein
LTTNGAVVSLSSTTRMRMTGESPSGRPAEQVKGVKCDRVPEFLATGSPPLPVTPALQRARPVTPAFQPARNAGLLTGPAADRRSAAPAGKNASATGDTKPGSPRNAGFPAGPEARNAGLLTGSGGRLGGRRYEFGNAGVPAGSNLPSVQRYGPVRLR